MQRDGANVEDGDGEVKGKEIEGNEKGRRNV